ncbi:IclR family transcriptional regulator [Dactylosporangium sp. NPDC051485]|uniref:IclR family transcriptional regulator n=1 Tax=Dactylosporangium sp. NPDC051485 TaxID=3154846 RepID=UPI00343EC7BF
MNESSAAGHRTVSRVMAILEAAAATRQGVTLSALTTLLDAPKSSVHGLVKGLVATGYLEESGRSYTIGPAVDMLIARGTSSVMASAHRTLETLVQTFAESATLCKLVGEDVVYVDIVESTQPIRYSAPLRVRRPLYPTSAGKCFLAHMTPGRRDAYLRANLPPHRAPEVLAELEAVFRDGYSTNHGETVPDVFAVSSPIIAAGRVVACLQVAGPSSRMAERMDEIARTVRAEAQRLSQRARG